MLHPKEPYILKTYKYFRDKILKEINSKAVCSVQMSKKAKTFLDLNITELGLNEPSGLAKCHAMLTLCQMSVLKVTKFPQSFWSDRKA